MPRNIDFKHIWDAYWKANDTLLAKENKARSAAGKNKWFKNRTANEYAYFVLLFSYLEGHINEQCEILRRKRVATLNWKRKRLWDTIDVITDIPFKNRLSLVTDRGRATFRDIMDYYKVRNDLVHGTLSEIVDISIFIKITQSYLKILKV